VKKIYRQSRTAKVVFFWLSRTMRNGPDATCFWPGSPSANDFVEVPADIHDSDKTHDMANPFLHHDPEPIPELPMDIEVYAKHILPADVEQYIQPLYTRRWGIGVSRVKYSRGDRMLSHLLPQLSKGFSFVHYTTALRFASEIVSIAGEENVSLIWHSCETFSSHLVCSIKLRLL
jgi:hypothetical protein